MKTAGDKTAGDKTAGNATAGDKTAGNATAGDKTAGDKTDSDVMDNDVMDNDVMDNDVMDNDVMDSDVMDSGWMVRGKCRDLDPAIFFPNDGTGVQVAQRICADCPVKASCLEYALANRVDHGVWGGTSERERRRILRAHRLATLRTGLD